MAFLRLTDCFKPFQDGMAFFERLFEFVFSPVSTDCVHENVIHEITWISVCLYFIDGPANNDLPFGAS